MVSVHVLTAPVDDEWRRQRIFQGDILIFKQMPEVKKLIEWADELAREAFGEIDPQTAQEHLNKEDYLAVVEPFMRKYSHSPRTRELFRDIFKAAGVAPEETYMAHKTIRVQPYGNTHIARNTAALGLHRDSWYSRLYEQNNWWMPIYPLEPERCLVFYPRYWQTPIANTSEGWDLDEFRQARQEITDRRGTFEELKKAYPAVVAAEPVDSSGELRFVLDPGDIIAFSLAHLHEGVPNTSAATRFSTETRTINIKDTVAGRGAPNIDGKGSGTALGDFYRLSDEKWAVDAYEEMKGVRS